MTSVGEPLMRPSFVRALALTVAFLLPALFTFWPRDTAMDWVLLKAGWEGLDISQPLHDLAVKLEVEAAETHYLAGPVARPPGFFSLYTPGLVSQLWLTFTVAILNAAAVAYLSRGVWWIAGGVMLLLAESLIWVNPAALWAGLIAVTRKHLDDGWKWGVPLGMAAAVRLWPLLPVAFLMLIRKRVGWGAAGTFAVLTGLGLLIVSPVDAVNSIMEGSGWRTLPGANWSLSTFLERIWIPVAVTVGVGSVVTLAAARRLAPFGGFGLSVLAAVILSPLAWPAYLASTAPAWKLPTRRN